MWSAEFEMRNFGISRNALILLVVFAVSCSGTISETQADTRKVVKDDLGREVRLPERIQRVISLAPSATEMIFAAGAGDRVVGVTTYCNFPEAAKSIEKVGDTQTPNIERIIALKPDIVFVSTASQLEAFMSTLAQQNIAVYVTDPKGIDGVTANLRTLGTLFGTERMANSFVGELQSRAADVDERVKGKPRPKVFVQFSKEQLFTIGRDAFLTKVIASAGGESVTKDVPSGFPNVSKETASAMNPDVIILSDSEDNREANDVLRNSPAVVNGRVYKIDPDIISRPGPRLVDALEQIADFLHK